MKNQLNTGFHSILKSLNFVPRLVALFILILVFSVLAVGQIEQLCENKLKRPEKNVEENSADLEDFSLQELTDFIVSTWTEHFIQELTAFTVPELTSLSLQELTGPAILKLHTV